MYSWETALTTRDTNRIVRPLEWGFDWLEDFSPLALAANPHLSDYDRMIAVNRDIVVRADEFFGYETPTDFRLERRHPQLYPTNVRPETLQEDAELRRQAETGEIEAADFLRFTSPIRTRYPENDIVNARWYPAHPDSQKGKPKQAIIVMPQWNADAFSHNALCTLFNSFGISCLRLSKPYHDVRRPAELERSDYAVSSNVGRTTEACRQAVVDIRSCVDWLEPASAAATPSSPPHSTSAFRSAPSTTPPPGLETSSGLAKAPDTSALPSSRLASRMIRSARSSPSSVPCPTWTASPPSPSESSSSTPPTT